jgi:C-terminal processing protease CtpA/Prc
VTRLAAVALLFLALLGACGPNKGTIGAVLGQDSEGRLFVRDVPAGLAAERADLRPGDEILLIDGRDARALGARGVHEALEGKVGESVKLTLVRDGQILRVTLKRTPPKKHRFQDPGSDPPDPPKNP